MGLQLVFGKEFTTLSDAPCVPERVLELAAAVVAWGLVRSYADFGVECWDSGVHVRLGRWAHKSKQVLLLCDSLPTGEGLPAAVAAALDGAAASPHIENDRIAIPLVVPHS